MTSRRNFIGSALASAVVTSVPQALRAAEDRRMMWGMLLHFGFNMWNDVYVDPTDTSSHSMICAADHVRFDEALWREVTAKLAEEGCNTLVIDIGEALAYPSHPELAVEGSWTPERFRRELTRLRALGFEVFPKLNFSCGHNMWLKDYRNQVSTPAYYKVCADVIRDVCEIFGRPRLFHVGYDEETWINQRFYGRMVVRQGEAWWKDFLWLVKTVEDLGMRPWMWSDYCWDHPYEFLTRCPKSVLQSNWRYGVNCSEEEFKRAVSKEYWSLRTFVELDRRGFEQVPTGSNYKDTNAANFGNLVDFCDRHVAPQGIRGYLQTSWCPTLPKYRDRLLAAAKIIGDVIRRRDPAKAAASFDPALNGFLPPMTAESDRKGYALKEEDIKRMFWPGY